VGMKVYVLNYDSGKGLAWTVGVYTTEKKVEEAVKLDSEEKSLRLSDYIIDEHDLDDMIDIEMPMAKKTVTMNKRFLREE
jgi:hypothetical protein